MEEDQEIGKASEHSETDKMIPPGDLGARGLAEVDDKCSPVICLHPSDLIRFGHFSS